MEGGDAPSSQQRNQGDGGRFPGCRSWSAAHVTITKQKHIPGGWGQTLGGGVQVQWRRDKDRLASRSWGREAMGREVARAAAFSFLSFPCVCFS